MNISFKAISQNVISALNTEVTGQLDPETNEQLPDVKYRGFFKFEEDVIKALKEKAKNNNDYDIFVTQPYKDKRFTNRNCVNKYGDCLSIVDRRTKETVKNISDAITTKLTPAQMINNLKFAVMTAEKLSQDSQNGLWNKICNHFKKPVLKELNQDSRNKIFNNTIYQYEAKDSKLLEKIQAPDKNILDTNGLEINCDEKDINNYKKYHSQFENQKCHHNIIQRSIGTPDEKIELENFLKTSAPEMEAAKSFTRDDYNKLSNKEKEQLREFVNTRFNFSYGKNRVKSIIQEDVMFLDGFSNIVKDKLDKKYGQGGYVLIGIGSSPSCMLELIKEKGVETINMPFSKDVLNNSGCWVKNSSKQIDWAKYLKNFSLSVEDIEKYKKDNKKVVILDYEGTGRTKELLEYKLKYDAKLQPTDYEFEDLGRLCWDADVYQTELFIENYLTQRKAKLYSTCQNAGNTTDFYENIQDYEKEYKWHPLTKLFFFAHYDQKPEMAEKFNNWMQEKITPPREYFLR